MFKAATSLLGRYRDVCYPPHTDSVGLANDFGIFFCKKINDIQVELDENGLTDTDKSLLDEFGTLSDEYSTSFEEAINVSEMPSIQSGISFTDFETVTPDFVRDLIIGFLSKSCLSDPVPTQIVKDCLVEVITFNEVIKFLRSFQTKIRKEQVIPNCLNVNSFDLSE